MESSKEKSIELKDKIKDLLQYYSDIDAVTALTTLLSMKAIEIAHGDLAKAELVIVLGVNKSFQLIKKMSKECRNEKHKQ